MPALIQVPTWVDGELVRMAKLNTLAYDIDSLSQILLGKPAALGPYTKPLVRVCLSGPQTIPSGTTAVVRWDSAVADSDGMFATGLSSQSRITIRTAGWYRLAAQASWPSASGAGQRVVQIMVNGTHDPLNVVASSSRFPQAGGKFRHQVIAYEHLAVGATVYVMAFQASGSGLALQAAAPHGTYLTAVYDAPY